MWNDGFRQEVHWDSELNHNLCALVEIYTCLALWFERSPVWFLSSTLCVSTGEDPTVRNPHLQNRGRRKPEERFWNIRLDSDSCEVDVLSLWEAGSLIWKVFVVWAVYIFTLLCVFVVAQVASVNACRWRAAASTISRTGSTCLPNTHTLRWHPHTRLSPSATQWGCTHYSFILVHCTRSTDLTSFPPAAPPQLPSHPITPSRHSESRGGSTGHAYHTLPHPSSYGSSPMWGPLEPPNTPKPWSLSCLRPAPPLRPSAALCQKEVLFTDFAKFQKKPNKTAAWHHSCLENRCIGRYLIHIQFISWSDFMWFFLFLLTCSCHKSDLGPLGGRKIGHL